MAPAIPLYHPIPSARVSPSPPLIGSQQVNVESPRNAHLDPRGTRFKCVCASVLFVRSRWGRAGTAAVPVCRSVRHPPTSPSPVIAPPIKHLTDYAYGLVRPHKFAHRRSALAVALSCLPASALDRASLVSASSTNK